VFVGSNCTTTPSVFGADLPDSVAESPDGASRLIGQARRRPPIALGLHVPEGLSDDRSRVVLCARRFRSPTGMGLEGRGITWVPDSTGWPGAWPARVREMTVESVHNLSRKMQRVRGT
jgi:hypothetical protein